LECDGIHSFEIPVRNLPETLDGIARSRREDKAPFVGHACVKDVAFVDAHDRQSFDAESTALVAWALAWFTLGLASHSVVEIVSRAYYALRDTRTPVLVGVAAMGLNILLSFIFAWLFARLGWRPHGGLAFSNTVATTLEMIGLLWILRRRLGGLAFTRIWPGLWRTAFASLYMGLILMLWLRYTHGRSVWMVGVGGVLAGGLAFWLVAHSLRTPEARLLPALLRERLSLKTRSAPE